MKFEKQDMLSLLCELIKDNADTLKHISLGSATSEKIREQSNLQICMLYMLNEHLKEK